MSPPPKYYETNQFKSLAAKWEKKLEKDGLEVLDHEDGRPKKWSRDKFSRLPEWNASKAEYFRAAGKFLHDYTFDTPLDRLIWEHHSNGASQPEIASLIRKSNYRRSARWVRRAVERLVEIMLKDLLK